MGRSPRFVTLIKTVSKFSFASMRLSLASNDFSGFHLIGLCTVTSFCSVRKGCFRLDFMNHFRTPSMTSSRLRIVEPKLMSNASSIAGTLHHFVVMRAMDSDNSTARTLFSSTSQVGRYDYHKFVFFSRCRFCSNKVLWTYPSQVWRPGPKRRIGHDS